MAVAQAQAVVEQAGGIVVRDNLELLLYNTEDDILNPHFIVDLNSNDGYHSLSSLSWLRFRLNSIASV